MKTVIVFGSMTGTTETVAKQLTAELDGTAIDASKANEATFAECDLLILGASTWGFGEIQDDMYAFIDRFKGMNLSISTAATFGLGDQHGYCDTFVDGIADMAAAIDDRGIKRIGAWPKADYSYNETRAEENGALMGLALDNDNEPEKTADRIAVWAKQLQQEVGA